MARKRTSKSTSASRRTPTKRTGIVWASFVAAMSVVGAILLFLDGGPRTAIAATSVVPLAQEAQGDGLFTTRASLDRQRWTSIVIHHSGMPAGDAESLHRMHLDQGYQGLGYHFVIGNGQGMDDGALQIGYRWLDQLPGAHALGDKAEHFNQHAISICLIGNGDRRTFSDLQLRELTQLVQRLQRELGIAPASVHLHREIAGGAPGLTSPGRFFPAAALREQLLR